MKPNIIIMALILFGLLCIMSVLWSCDARPVPSDLGSDVPSEIEGIRVYTDSDNYPSDIGSITLQIQNKSGYEAAFGLQWQAEVYLSGDWYIIPFRKPAAFPEIAQLLSDGETGSLTLDLSSLSYKLNEGRYRIVKEVSGKILAAEFKIIK